MNNKSLIIGSDHAGFEAKQLLIEYLKDNHYTVKDIGTYNDSSIDYPDFAHPVALAVAKGEYQQGILLCGSGNGVCMSANKHEGIRAALCWTEEIAQLARQHNDANVLCVPARFVSESEIEKMAMAFLNTSFEGGRHEARRNKIDIK